MSEELGASEVLEKMIEDMRAGTDKLLATYYGVPPTIDLRVMARRWCEDGVHTLIEEALEP